MIPRRDFARSYSSCLLAEALSALPIRVEHGLSPAEDPSHLSDEGHRVVPPLPIL